MKIKYLFLLVLIYFIIILGCHKSKDVGGYKENYSLKNNEYKVDTVAFNKFISNFSESNFLTKYDHSKKLIFKIDHCNGLSLQGKGIIIMLDKSENNELLYNGDYKRTILLNIGYDKPYYANIRFYVLDYNNKTISKFSSDLHYPIFNNSYNEVHVKLFSEVKFKYNDLQMLYEITNIPDEIGENKHR